MIDLIKKAMFTGIGIASLTKDKVEEIAKEFAEMIRHLSQQCDMSEAELKKIIKEHLQESN